MQNATDKFIHPDSDIQGISNDDKIILDDDITVDEIADAVKNLSNNKSPGSDGFPIEFYKFFWSKIKTYVCNSILYGVTNGELSTDQRRGILTLIPKKDKDTCKLKNWRPLTLLNSDYKIFAKLMAKRLQSVLTQIISPDQSGCIKGRSTFNNIRSTIDIINYTNEQNLPGILAFIDYEKAFDTVKWNFLYKCLEAMNFGNYFINCIKTMYSNIQTSVSNNGHLSQAFMPSRGIRQGCPISCNLFVIIVEFLACASRKNPNVKGIIINNIEFKISQFADDTCLYLKDLQSLKYVFSILDLFTACSGLKVNRGKSEAIGIGASSTFRHKGLGIK